MSRQVPKQVVVFKFELKRSWKLKIIRKKIEIFFLKFQHFFKVIKKKKIKNRRKKISLLWENYIFAFAIRKFVSSTLIKCIPHANVSVKSCFWDLKLYAPERSAFHYKYGLTKQLKCLRQNCYLFAWEVGSC